MFSACGRHQTDSSILSQQSSTSLPRLVVPRSFCLANCNALHCQQITCARSSVKLLAPGQLKGISHELNF